MSVTIEVYQLVKDAPIAIDKILVVVKRGDEILARKVVEGRLLEQVQS